MVLLLLVINAGRSSADIMQRGTVIEHTCQVVGENIGPHLEVVDYHCRQRGCGIEEAAVYHQNIDVLGSQPCTADVHVTYYLSFSSQAEPITVLQVHLIHPGGLASN